MKTRRVQSSTSAKNLMGASIDTIGDDTPKISRHLHGNWMACPCFQSTAELEIIQSNHVVALTGA